MSSVQLTDFYGVGVDCRLLIVDHTIDHTIESYPETSQDEAAVVVVIA